MTYEPVIGLEIHIQAKTKSKMFCSCAASYFGADPNTHVCPVCLGLPGALPVPNKKAIDLCLNLALALNCEINKFSKFDRKNYFYPDLPKAYQISQYDLPFGYNGFLEVNIKDDAKRFRIHRVHMEEDTGKSSHMDSGETHLDYNKSGVPLIEVVTEPDFQEVSEVTAFAKLLRQTVIYTGVSDAEMQKGQMRFELNISVREAGTKILPNYKVEIKNIGSISVLEKVIEFELERQSKLLDSGITPDNETRGLRDLSGVTYSQRAKETAADYRYFPEPDIPPITISDEWVSSIKENLPELPGARRQRYMYELGIEGEQADILVEQTEKGDWIDLMIQETLTKKYEDRKLVMKEIVKWFTGEVSGHLEKQGKSLDESPVSRADLIYLVESLIAHRVSGTIVKKVISELFEKGGIAEEIISTQGLEQITDPEQIRKLVIQVINENPAVVDSLGKNPNAAKALVGKVMGLSKGQANPQMVDEILRSELKI